MRQNFERVALVNRGEAAVRFLHAAREFNQENQAFLRTIALFTEPDRHAMFVRQADEAFCLGARQTFDPATHQPKSVYLDYGHLESALRKVRAEAVWVGWGFLAEQAQFADLCRDMGIVFIGPDGDVMRRLSDKAASKPLAEQVQIPVAGWNSGELVDDVRHVEVQVIADHYGTVWAAGVRDCTLHHRDQKILREAPSPALNSEQHKDLRRMAVSFCQAAGYSNAGTLEFLYDEQRKRFFFSQIRTQLPAADSVTECTTSLDLVKLQIYVAQGGRLLGDPPATIGHAIEVQLNAEDPDNGFAPCPGILERFRIHAGPGIRIDTGVQEGDSIPAEFDSTIARITAYGHDRKEALARLQRALHESVVVIKGGASNRAFLLNLLQREELRDGTFDIGWLDRLVATGEHLSREHVEIALIQAAIESYEAELRVEQAQFYATALRGRPHVRADAGHIVQLRWAGNVYELKISRTGLDLYRIEVDGTVTDARVEATGAYERWLSILGRRFHVVAVEQGSSFRIEVDGVSHRVERDDGGVVRAPSPAVVVSIAVQPGDEVAAGDRVAVLEAMKMEMQVVAPFAGKVRQVLAIPNVQVSPGDALLQLEPLTTQTGGEQRPRANFMGLSTHNGDKPGREERALQVLDELQQLMLGFDVSAERAARLVAEFKQLTQAPLDGEDVRRREEAILNIFVDLCALFRTTPRGTHHFGSQAPSTESYLFGYLRMLDMEGEGLPPDVVQALERMVKHYGIAGLNPTPALEQCMMWIYKSHQRLEQQIPTILTILQRRLANPGTHSDDDAEALRPVLDRLVGITRELFPVVNDLARELRYCCYEQPFFEHTRRQVYAAMEEHLDRLAESP